MAAETHPFGSPEPSHAKFTVPNLPSNPPRPIPLEPRHIPRKIPRVQRIAHLLHQVQVVVQVVDGGQHGAEHFAAAVQVVHVGAAETTSATLFP